MRTKTLLLAAALSAAGLATSMAQSNVYSLNIVGYVNKVCPEGGKYVQWSNPLKTDNNSVTNLFLQAPASSQFLKWDGSAWSLIFTKLTGPGTTLWGGSGDNTVPNGGGGFFRSPTASTVPYTNTFVGEVIQTSTNHFNSGYSIISDMYPVDTDANTSGLTAKLTPGSSTQIIQWDGNAWSIIHTLVAPGVWGGSPAGPPAWKVGESFFLRSLTAGDWIQ